MISEWLLWLTIETGGVPAKVFKKIDVYLGGASAPPNRTKYLTLTSVADFGNGG